MTAAASRARGACGRCCFAAERRFAVRGCVSRRRGRPGRELSIPGAALASMAHCIIARLQSMLHRRMPSMSPNHCWLLRDDREKAAKRGCGNAAPDRDEPAHAGPRRPRAPVAGLRVGRGLRQRVLHTLRHLPNRAARCRVAGLTLPSLEQRRLRSALLGATPERARAFAPSAPRVRRATRARRPAPRATLATLPRRLRSTGLVSTRRLSSRAWTPTS